jgi:hypothetical protein
VYCTGLRAEGGLGGWGGGGGEGVLGAGRSWGLALNAADASSCQKNRSYKLDYSIPKGGRGVVHGLVRGMSHCPPCWGYSGWRVREGMCTSEMQHPET